MAHHEVERFSAGARLFHWVVTLTAIVSGYHRAVSLGAGFRQPG